MGIVSSNSTLYVAVNIYYPQLCDHHWLLTRVPEVQLCCSSVEVLGHNLEWVLWRFAGLVATEVCRLVVDRAMPLGQTCLVYHLQEAVQLVCQRRPVAAWAVVAVLVRSSPPLGHQQASSRRQSQGQVIDSWRNMAT